MQEAKEAGTEGVVATVRGAVMAVVAPVVAVVKGAGVRMAEVAMGRRRPAGWPAHCRWQGWELLQAPESIC